MGSLNGMESYKRTFNMCVMIPVGNELCTENRMLTPWQEILGLIDRYRVHDVSHNDVSILEGEL